MKFVAEISTRAPRAPACCTRGIVSLCNPGWPEAHNDDLPRSPGVRIEVWCHHTQQEPLWNIHY